MTGGGEKTGGGHGPLPVAAHHGEPARRYVGGRDGGELDVDCAGDVAARVFVRLADIDQSSVVVCGADERDRRERSAAGPPGVDAAAEFTDEVLMANVEALANE